MADYQNIRIPPDSTGKRIQHRVALHLDYDNGTIDFVVGDKIVGATSGFEGDITSIEGTTAAGELDIILAVESETTIVDGENLQVGGVTYATADGTGTKFYIPSMIITGFNNPHNSAYVDGYGSLHVKYHQGDPVIDLIGRYEVTNHRLLGDYRLRYGKESNYISETLSVSASSTYMGDVPCVEMATTTVSGDKVERRTDAYHVAPPAAATGAYISIWHGDTGRANHRRRWGAYDDNNGYFFELDGTTLYVVYRSKVTGSVVDTRIAQANWNGDRLDGTDGDFNKSGQILDITKSNSYWFEWLATTVVRFGVVVGGARVTCHTVGVANTSAYNLIGTADLPLSWEIENTDTADGNSEMYVCDSGAWANVSSYNMRRFLGRAYVENVAVSGADWTPLFSVRPAQTYNGKDNRAWLIPYRLDIITDTKPIVYDIRLSGSLTGATWANSFSTGEYDTAATAVVGGVQAAYGFCYDHETYNHIEKDREISPQVAKITRKADITATPTHVTVSAKSLDESPTNVSCTLTWIELGI